MISNFISNICDIVKETGAELAIKFEFTKTEDIYLLTLGQASQRVKSITEQQAEILKQNKIGCEVIEVKAPVSDMNDSEFAGKKQVFLQIIKGEITYDMLRDICNKLEEYQIEIVGMEFIDVA